MRETEKKYSRKSFGKHMRDILIVMMIGVLVSFLFNPYPANVWHFVFWNAMYGGVIGGTLWKGNEAVAYLVWKKFRSRPDPAMELRWNLTLMFIYSLTAIFVVNYAWFLIMAGSDATIRIHDWIITMVIQFGITMIIGSVMYSIGFFKAWRESAVNEEKLKRQSLALRYEALRNQVNPHFLFNSLNTLSSLVHKDQDLAEKFIKQLSEVYRYVLEQKEREIVDLRSELDFVARYVYLQKIRHGNSLRVDSDIHCNQGEMVIPLSVQILVENAIKHNTVAIDDPLMISIYKEPGFVVIKNNLNRKQVIPDRSGVGLSNLRERYNFLSDKKLIVDETNGEFIVKIPLIKSFDV